MSQSVLGCILTVLSTDKVNWSEHSSCQVIPEIVSKAVMIGLFTSSPCWQQV